MKKLKVGMISFAHGHAFSYLHSLHAIPEVEVVGIADPIESRVSQVVSKHSLPYYANYHQLLDTDVDAVVICSENSFHAEITIAAARKGKHVLCEKPLGIHLEDMKEMISTCQDNNVQLMTAFPCRYLAAVVQAKHAIDRGEIGDIVAFKGSNHGTAPDGWFVDPKLSGGGALLDHTVHVMDLMNWFNGSSEAKEVYAYAATLFDDKLTVDDAGMIHVKFENGVFGVLDTSWSRKAPYPTWGDVNLDIIGTKGVISVNGLAQVNELYSRQNSAGQWNYWGDNMDEHLVRAFVQAIRSGQPVPISGEDGMRSTLAALAGYRSLKEGQPVSV